MKTVLLPLETHDDVASISDKITAHNGQRLILVWPKRGKVIRNAVELALLKRDALSGGTQIAIVSHHPAIRDWAGEVGLACFASVPAAEKGDWQVRSIPPSGNRIPQGIEVILKHKAKVNPENKKLPSHLERILALVLTTGSLLALLFFLLPGATILCYPQTSQQQIEVPIKASLVFSGFSPSGNVPAAPLYIEVNGELETPASGTTSLPENKAAGDVEFHNLGLKSVDLPAGTLIQLVDSQVTFILLESLEVPAGIGETAVGGVEAIQPGVSGNLAADQLLFVQGTTGLLVSVTNPHPFNGGTEIIVASPTEDDYQSLEKDLLDDLRKKALENAMSEVSQGSVLIPETLALDQVLLEEQVNKVGDPADTALLRMNVRFQAITYQENDLISIAEVGLNASLPPGMIVVPDTIRIESMNDLKVDEFGQAIWTMLAVRSLQPQWDAADAANRLAGKRIDEGKEIVSGLFAQRQPAEIRTSIKNWPWMPFLSFRIELIQAGVE